MAVSFGNSTREELYAGSQSFLGCFLPGQRDEHEFGKLRAAQMPQHVDQVDQQRYREKGKADGEGGIEEQGSVLIVGEGGDQCFSFGSDCRVDRNFASTASSG